MNKNLLLTDQNVKKNIKFVISYNS
jgi:hypothetical protein